MLTRARIRNFRSISDISLDFENLNILIGRNDTGKSNVLRALNLFFNGETDFRVPFNFGKDFSSHAITGQGKAPEVRIDLTFKIPTGYQAPEDARSLQWTRRWRSDNTRIDEPQVFLKKGNRKEEISGRSRIGSFLKNVDYHYIPALKGREFFSELLADIYDVLSEVSEEQILTASTPLQDEVTNILNDVASELSLVLREDSNPKLPSNLRSVFRLIQFESEGIDLDRRGDGIRVRHVPSLVKFLCDLKAQRSGRFQTFHIWGLEEPENSVDLLSAFDLRSQIYEISQKQEYQLIISTHSPVFFNLEDKQDSSTFLFSKVNGVTSLTGDDTNISTEMGFMRVVSPYIERSVKEAETLQESLDTITKKLENDVLDPSQKVVFVEGETDATLFRVACSELKMLLDVKFITTISEGNSSANSVADNLIAWHFLQKNLSSDKRVIGVGIVDGDLAGDKASKILQNRLHEEKSRYVKISKLRPTKSLAQKIVKFGFVPNITLEHLAPSNCWEHAYENGWLETKSYEQILNCCTNENKKKILSSGMEKLMKECPVEIFPFVYDVSLKNKKDFSSIFISEIGKNPELVGEFKPTVFEIRSFFSGVLA